MRLRLFDAVCGRLARLLYISHAYVYVRGLVDGDGIFLFLTYILGLSDSVPGTVYCIAYGLRVTGYRLG